MLTEKVWLTHDADGKCMTSTWCWWRRYDFHMMLTEKVWLAHDADGEGMTYTWCWWRRYDLHMMLMEIVWLTHDADGEGMTYTWCWWRRSDLHMMLMEKVWLTHDADGEDMAYTWYCWRMSYLKGQCHEIFCFWFISWISFPPSPRVFQLDRFEFFRIFSIIRGDIRESRCTTGINDTGGKFFHHFR